MTTGIGGTLATNNIFVRQENDFNSKNTRGGVFAIALPPGEYEFNRWMIHIGKGSGFKPSNPKKALFKVEANKVTYIGNLNMLLRTAKDIAGKSPVIGGRPVITNKAKRDFSFLKRKYPILAKKHIDIKVVEYKSANKASKNFEEKIIEWDPGITGYVRPDEVTIDTSNLNLEKSFEDRLIKLNKQVYSPTAYLTILACISKYETGRWSVYPMPPRTNQIIERAKVARGATSFEIDYYAMKKGSKSRVKIQYPDGADFSECEGKILPSEKSGLKPYTIVVNPEKTISRKVVTNSYIQFEKRTLDSLKMNILMLQLTDDTESLGNRMMLGMYVHFMESRMPFGLKSDAHKNMN